jgi:protein-L-isoaspartate(D-aspartate) O-methyltransferase
MIRHYNEMKKTILIFMTLIACLGTFLGETLNAEESHDQYEAARKKLVYNHLHDKGIENAKVLDAVYAVKRHLFLPSSLWPKAYQDVPLPLGNGGYVIEPSLVALIADKLYLTGKERILVIGTREGYLCAVLAGLAGEVYTIESDYSLYRQAEAGFYAHKLTNIWMRLSANYFNWKQGILFDCIVVNGAVKEVSPELLGLLKEGGTLIIPLGDKSGFQELVRMVKTNAHPEKQFLSYVMFPPLQ